jgi:flagellar M-ring protein FliF
MSSALVTLLQRTTGAGKVAVTVSADLQLDQIQSTSEDYGPIGEGDGTYVIAEETANEAYGDGVIDGTTGILGPDGVTVTETSMPAATDVTATTLLDPAVLDGTATTIAGATATTIPGTVTTDPAYGSSTGSRTYAIDRVVQQTTTAPGRILQLHVAVLVDDTAIDEQQAVAIEKLVSTAAGLDTTRGDTVVISRLPFDTSAQVVAEELTKESALAKEAAEKNQLYRTLAVAAVIIVALFLAYRSARRARRTTATPINIGEIGAGKRPIAPATELAPIVMESAMSSQIDRHEAAMGEVARVAERRPEDVANVLRSWLADSPSRPT